MMGEKVREILVAWGHCWMCGFNDWVTLQRGEEGLACPKCGDWIIAKDAKEFPAGVDGRGVAVDDY